MIVIAIVRLVVYTCIYFVSIHRKFEEVSDNTCEKTYPSRQAARLLQLVVKVLKLSVSPSIKQASQQQLPNRPLPVVVLPMGPKYM